jgi:hypothetical protein
MKRVLGKNSLWTLLSIGGYSPVDKDLLVWDSTRLLLWDNVYGRFKTIERRLGERKGIR